MRRDFLKWVFFFYVLQFCFLRKCQSSALWFLKYKYGNKLLVDCKLNFFQLAKIRGKVAREILKNILWFVDWKLSRGFWKIERKVFKNSINYWKWKTPIFQDKQTQRLRKRAKIGPKLRYFFYLSQQKIVATLKVVIYLVYIFNL